MRGFVVCAVVWMTLGLVSGGCDDSGGSGGTPSPGGAAQKDGGGVDGDVAGGDAVTLAGPVKVDLLLVVDGSVSMCQEQNSLTKSMEAFVGALSAGLEVDLRAAVVTMNAIAETEKGAFHHAAPSAFPPNCMERRVVSCLLDQDCQDALDGAVPTPASWVCDPPGQGAQYLENKNGSINSSCRYFCDSDAGCATELDGGSPESTWMCIQPGGDKTLSGCLEPPAVAGCPSELPAVADLATAESLGMTLPALVGCLAQVGAFQDQSAQLEQGLLCAALALDTAGPNAEQAAGFVREDAYQIIMFLSDEEDCSLPDGASMPTESWSTCGLLGDTADGGPLAPVSDLAAKLMAVNPDPSHVLVGAIVGDVVVKATAEPTATLAKIECPDAAYESVDACVAAKREAWRTSKGGPGPLARNSYVCASELGTADLGSRYLALVEVFGDRGAAANICDPSGLGSALVSIGAKLRAQLK